MASTNHTQNYSLSQFVGSDKPAWLGDYNQDMSKIDTAMKANADANATTATTVAGHTTAIAGNTSDIASMKTDVTAIDGRVTTLEGSQATQDTAISQAQSDATSALATSATNTQNIAKQALDITSLQNDVQTNAGAIASNTKAINNVDGKVDGLASEMNLSQHDAILNPTSIDGATTNGSMTEIHLSQSPNSTIFKVYGRLDIYHGSGSYTYARHAITGLTGYYGLKTTLKLNVAPQESYVINPAGSAVTYTPGQDGSQNYFNSGCAIAVDTEGYIWLDVSTSNSQTVTAWQRYVHILMPCLYFNGNFGDTPTPPEA